MHVEWTVLRGHEQAARYSLSRSTDFGASLRAEDQLLRDVSRASFTRMRASDWQSELSDTLHGEAQAQGCDATATATLRV